MYKTIVIEEERPKAKMIGEDGNIFNLMGIASRTLKSAGYEEKANEMLQTGYRLITMSVTGSAKAILVFENKK